MFLLRFIFRSVFVWLATRLLGRFLPFIVRFLRLVGWWR
jgi:hypothetical protein